MVRIDIMGNGASFVDDPRPLIVFLNPCVDVTSWTTILAALQNNLHYAYVAFERDDDTEIVALSYRWDDDANKYAASEDWSACLQQLQASHSYQLGDHPHVHRLKEHVAVHKKIWVDQHCIPQVDGRMGCVKAAATLYHGRVFAAWLTNNLVDRAFETGKAWDLLGNLNEWLGRGWVQQEVTARGLLVNLSAFEYFLEKARDSQDDGLRSGAESLCLLLRRMKGNAEEPLADRIIRFYAVGEAGFTVDADRAINLPTFSDVGYEAFPIGAQPDGYVLQSEITIHGDRVVMVDSNGNRIAKWFKYMALYRKA